MKLNKPKLSKLKSKKFKSNMSNKLGVSIIVSYVLLILLSITMAAVVYTFMKYKARLPTEIKCPEGVSIYLYNYSCNGEVNITIKNNGFFNISGINVKLYKNVQICNQTGDIDLIIVPNEIGEISISKGSCSNVSRVDILPFRKEIRGVKTSRIYCKDARIVQEINC